MSIIYRTSSLAAVGASAAIAAAELTAPGPGQAVVRLRAAGLNHRDLWIRKGQYAGLKFPIVPGSDGAGVVESVGPDADAAWVGRRVVINPALDWGPSPEAQGKDFRILGLPDPGTFAEYVIVPAGNLAPMPEHLSFEEAACLPLAGTTAYRALFTRGRIREGETLLITGIGGGVAMLLQRMALAAKARVFVTSGSEEKLSKAIASGAEGGVLYTRPDWAETLAAQAGPFDCIIDSAGGPGFSKLCDLCRSGGRLVFFGATAGNPPELPLRKVFWRQLNVLGTTMGSPRDFADMIRLVNEAKIRPVIDGIYPLEETEAAFRRMESGGQFGKLVLKISEEMDPKP